MNGKVFRDKLDEKNKEELKLLAKKLGVTGYSNLNKVELVDLIIKSDLRKLEGEICPSWWHKYHNHVYGSVTVLALVLSVVFYFIPFADNEDPYLEGPRRVVNVLENPVGFRGYSSMNQLKQEEVFNLHNGQRVTWEGYISSFVGFMPGVLGQFQFEREIGIRLTPFRDSNNGLVAFFAFEPISPTDSGYELVSQLYLLSKGQRVRVNGALEGTFVNPVLTDAWIESVFPINE